ncbi:hypothetical protein D0Z08_28320 [Nocardioides immobilis]|uniref:Uncharacterized protein n=2 Tax=Nocardioides immobilis TaxID=2049295 RepID=A0A417XTQ9_9ACTN|nr:hypothetical protein D0Z08_28320 [Nocardioides immobilis]
MTLPKWMWNGAVDGFIEAARLRSIPSLGLDPDEFRIETLERGSRERPGLVTMRQLAGPPLTRANYEPLQVAEAEVRSTRYLSDGDLEATQMKLARVQRSAEKGTAAGLIAPGLAFHQLQTMLADPTMSAETVETVADDIRECRLASTDERVFPTSGVFLVRRNPALLHRSKIPAVLLRIARDGKLQQADLEDIKTANADGEVVFAASDGLGDGFAHLDSYLMPLLGALSPYVWAFSATRLSGTIIYTLGTAVAGTAGEAVEPLQLLPSREALTATSLPNLSVNASAAAMTWWARRLDKTLSVISDPALFSDADGRYVPAHHQHALLSLDQVFRRTGSIQRSHRDGDARRVMMFTVLDTLERLTDRRLVELCTHSFASRTLDQVRKDMNSEAQEIFLPAAERAVRALEQVQDGFYLRRQTGAASIDFNLADGSTESFTPEQAAAEYIRVLRNATHGHGSNREDAVPRTDALLTHHDGTIHHDLPLLAYLYLLELLTRPDLLRQVLFSSSRV